MTCSHIVVGTGSPAVIFESGFKHIVISKADHLSILKESAVLAQITKMVDGVRTTKGVIYGSGGWVNQTKS
jgi:hypothetical protein